MNGKTIKKIRRVVNTKEEEMVNQIFDYFKTLSFIERVNIAIKIIRKKLKGAEDMKTMLDKVAVAGDITQAIDRRGAWTCAIVVIGGTDDTAVKLQTCDTAAGVYSDFKTLISADDASTDQYKGFVIDLDGAKKFIKVTGAAMATCVLGDCDADIKSVTFKAGTLPEEKIIEDEKDVTIDVSTYTGPVEIEPTEGKDGMAKVKVTLTNIPEATNGGD